MDKNTNRLVKLLAAACVLIVILLFSVVSLGVYVVAQLNQNDRDIQQRLASIEAKKLPDVINGKDGVTTIVHEYTPGKDGQNATDEQVQSAVNNYMDAHPVQNGKDGKDGVNGQDGQPGAPGLIVFIRQNILGQWECRFGSVTGWSPITECQ